MFQLLAVCVTSREAQLSWCHISGKGPEGWTAAALASLCVSCLKLWNISRRVMSKEDTGQLAAGERGRDTSELRRKLTLATVSLPR